MKNTFLDIIRTPDNIKIQTENSPFRFEEKGTPNETRAEIKCQVSNNTLNVHLYSNGDAVKFIRLRWNGDISGVNSMLGDSVARTQTDDAVWHGFLPHYQMPWYFYTNDGECWGDEGTVLLAPKFRFSHELALA